MEVKTIEGRAPGESENTAFTIGFKMPVRPIDANALKTKAHITRTRALDNLTIETLNVSVDEIEKAPTLSLNTLRDAIYQDAVAHGLWEDYDNFYAERIQNDALIVDKRYDCATSVHHECDELVNAFDDEEHFAEELADVIIMSLSVAGKLGIDIDAAIRRKMEVNKKRPWKHGKGG